MYPSQVLFGSMASSNDDFRTAICHTQNLSLIKFDYSSIEYFTILLFYNTQCKYYGHHDVGNGGWGSCLWKAMYLQHWTKLVETEVNSRNGSIFQILNSPPYPLISMLNPAKFCCQKPTTLRITLIWEGTGFFTEK